MSEDLAEIARELASTEFVYEDNYGYSWCITCAGEPYQKEGYIKSETRNPNPGPKIRTWYHDPTCPWLRAHQFVEGEKANG